MTLHLVRHGRPLMRPEVRAARWELDPEGFDDVRALRDRLPAAALWFSSPEPKARQTARLLTDVECVVVDDLREHERGSSHVEDFPAAVRRAFAHPDESVVDSWEPLKACRDRVVPAVHGLLEAHRDPVVDLVLVGHGTAWTLVVAALTRQQPDLERWASLAMPDVLVVADCGGPTMCP